MNDEVVEVFGPFCRRVTTAIIRRKKKKKRKPKRSVSISISSLCFVVLDRRRFVERRCERRVVSFPCPSRRVLGVVVAAISSSFCSPFCSRSSQVVRPHDCRSRQHLCFLGRARRLRDGHCRSLKIQTTRRTWPSLSLKCYLFFSPTRRRFDHKGRHWDCFAAGWVGAFNPLFLVFVRIFVMVDPLLVANDGTYVQVCMIKY
mmetsp:Transcript_7440/g.14138  ORF Transcript_7440/g.14138 Transcript_7440/m.14138 type:complete len:202 (-) Transcript_7440:56-661(-)